MRWLFYRENACKLVPKSLHKVKINQVGLRQVFLIIVIFYAKGFPHGSSSLPFGTKHA